LVILICESACHRVTVDVGRGSSGSKQEQPEWRLLQHTPSSSLAWSDSFLCWVL